MAERRTRNFMLALTPSEREALQRLSECEGSSGADVIRRLVLAEARRQKVVSSKAPATGNKSPQLEVST